MTDSRPPADELQPAPPRPQAAYWDAKSTAVMPEAFSSRSFEERAFDAPLELKGVAVDEPLPYERADSAALPGEQHAEAMWTVRQSALVRRFDWTEAMPEALLIDDADRVDAAVGVASPPGGPSFVGAATGTAPIVPLGVRVMPGAPAPGTFLPVRSVRRPAPPTARGRRSGRMLAGVLVLAILSAGGYAGYPRARAWIAARSVPADLRPYVSGKGVMYQPAALGYSVRLPGPAVRRDGPLTSSDHKLSMVVHRSIVAGADFAISIREAALPAPSVSVLPNGLAGALRDPAIAGGWPVDVRRVTFADGTAYEYGLPASPPIRVRMFLRARHLYVISVQSRSPGTVLDALMGSFVFN